MATPSPSLRRDVNKCFDHGKEPKAGEEVFGYVQQQDPAIPIIVYTSSRTAKEYLSGEKKLQPSVLVTSDLMVVFRKVTNVEIEAIRRRRVQTLSASCATPSL